MRTVQAKITEIGWQDGIGRTAWIECPPGARPAPGRYVLAWSPEQPEAPLATPLFACNYVERGFLAAPPVPDGWEPGTPLVLRGPLGRGFSPPANMGRLALAAVDTGLARLLPLMRSALAQGVAVAVYTDQPAPPLPLAVEINPLSALAEAGSWADYIAVDCGDSGRGDPAAGVPAEWSPESTAGQAQGLPLQYLGVPGQILMRVPMPCGGIAGCGACAVQTRRGLKMACEEGPVFELQDWLTDERK